MTAEEKGEAIRRLLVRHPWMGQLPNHVKVLQGALERSSDLCTEDVRALLAASIVPLQTTLRMRKKPNPYDRIRLFEVAAEAGARHSLRESLRDLIACLSSIFKDCGDDYDSTLAFASLLCSTSRALQSSNCRPELALLLDSFEEWAGHGGSHRPRSVVAFGILRLSVAETALALGQKLRALAHLDAVRSTLADPSFTSGKRNSLARAYLRAALLTPRPEAGRRINDFFLWIGTLPSLLSSANYYHMECLELTERMVLFAIEPTPDVFSGHLA
jgi:hypothetical protein